MITEADRIEHEKLKLVQEKEWCNQVIKVGERYERLLANKDFQDMLNDLRTTVKVHRQQLESHQAQLNQADSPFKVLRVAMVMKVHLMRLAQIEEAIQRPETLVTMANNSRERLDKIIELEKELPNDQ
jgi:hypothetical protein